jgi:hypothetical protein
MIDKMAGLFLFFGPLALPTISFSKYDKLAREENVLFY